MSASAACDSQVSGCQFAASKLVKAHLTVSPLRPDFTCWLEYTYSPSSKLAKGWLCTGKYSATVAATSSRTSSSVCLPEVKPPFSAGWRVCRSRDRGLGLLAAADFKCEAGPLRWDAGRDYKAGAGGEGSVERAFRLASSRLVFVASRLQPATHGFVRDTKSAAGAMLAHGKRFASRRKERRRRAIV